jgi:hypothetical protein
MMRYRRAKIDMKNFLQFGLTLLVLLLFCAVQGHSSNQSEGHNQTFDKITSTIRSQFGSKLKVIPFNLILKMAPRCPFTGMAKHIAALANGSVIRPKRFSERTVRLHNDEP